MKLNHLNLAVPNVPESRAFFEKYFGFQILGDQKANHAIAVLRDDDGFILTLSNFEKATEFRYPESFHIGFSQESTERVDQIYQQLKDDGFEAQAPRRFHGSWTFYFHAPGGILVEVSC